MQKLVILGVGGNCFDILDAVNAINDFSPAPAYECLGFLDDACARLQTTHLDLPILGTLLEAAQLKECVFVNGIGSPSNYWKKPDILRSTGLALNRFVTIVHPQASISRSACIAPGSVVLANSSLGANVAIGAHVMILQGVVISHNCCIDDFSCVASSACLSGGVVMEKGCYLGANATVRGGIRLGAGSMVGIGSVVIRDVPPRAVVAGNPARYLRSLEI